MKRLLLAIIATVTFGAVSLHAQETVVYKMDLKKEKDCTPTVYINVEGATSIDEVSTGFCIYPNPTTGTVYISVNQKEEDISILLINQEGRLLLEKTSQGEISPYPLSLADYPSGVYFIQLLGNQKATFKLIKK